MNYRKTVRRLVFLSLFAMGGITIQAQSVTKRGQLLFLGI